MNGAECGAQSNDQRDAILRDLALTLSNPNDVLCLHAICQPVVSEMQDVIRYQRRQLDLCVEALAYALNRIAAEQVLRFRMGEGTEVFGLLTLALAEASNRNVNNLRNEILPGSAAIHQEMEEE